MPYCIGSREELGALLASTIGQYYIASLKGTAYGTHFDHEIWSGVEAGGRAAHPASC